MTLFPFIQFEFTHSVGPDAGRYVVEPATGTGDAEQAPEAVGHTAEVTGITRAPASADVLVVAVVEGQAAPSRPLSRRRPRDAAPDTEAREVPLQLVTFVRATHQYAGSGAAQAALAALRGDEVEQEREIADALAILNRAVRAHRAAAGDPYVVEVTREDARSVRLGYGTAKEVYEGRWSEAFVPAPVAATRLSRTEQLRPSEAVAAVLVGRAQILEGEDLALRALVEQRHGRLRAGALMVAAAFDLLVAELGSEMERETGGKRLAQLEERRAEALALADQARRQPLNGSAGAEIERLAVAGVRLAHDWRYAQL